MHSVAALRRRSQAVLLCDWPLRGRCEGEHEACNFEKDVGCKDRWAGREAMLVSVDQTDAIACTLLTLKVSFTHLITPSHLRGRPDRWTTTRQHGVDAEGYAAECMAIEWGGPDLLYLPPPYPPYPLCPDFRCISSPLIHQAAMAMARSALACFLGDIDFIGRPCLASSPSCSHHHWRSCILRRRWR